MTIEEDRTIFRAICLDCLGAIIEKYSLSLECTNYEKTSSPEADERSIKVLFRNKTTGLSFQTISHGMELGVTLYQLIDGKILETRGKAYGLDWIILLRSPKLRVWPNLKVPPRLVKQVTDANGGEADKVIKDYKTENYTKLFLKYANALDVCASDVMKGDFSIFAELSDMSETQWQKLHEKLKH